MTRDKKISILVFILLILVSVASYYIFYQLDAILFYYDASSRLNIARKIIDNLTPGIGQIGTLWLPLPQVLMLPLIWHDPFWRSGFAGSAVSMIAFILSGFFLFKSIRIWTNDYLASFLTLFLFVTNINMVYMQSTPMSEPFFIMTLLGAMYFFIKWVKDDQIFSLLFFACFVSLATLTRYEGYLSLLFSFVMVALVLLIKRNPMKNVEGKLILFGTLAVTGVTLWTIYQTVIFGDPIYWLKVYTQQVSIISTEDNRVDAAAPSRDARRVSYPEAAVTFFNTGAQINGVIITYFSLLSLLAIGLMTLYKKDKQTALYSLSLLIPIGAFLFTTAAIRGGFPLATPHLTLEALFNGSNRYYEEYNIRYGLILIPLTLIPVGVFAARNTWRKILVAVVITAQTITFFLPEVYNQYSIPHYFLSKPREDNLRNSAALAFMKNNYDDGLILVSALKHDPEMFYLGLDYKTYIHEGTQKYWTESIKEPQKYAKWIYMFAPGVTTGREEDSVTKEMKENQALEQHFELVYQDREYHIYRRKE